MTTFSREEYVAYKPFERAFISNPAIDVTRAGLEFFRLIHDPIYMRVGAPMGMHDPVLVAPGHGNHDGDQIPLRNTLTGFKYKAEMAGFTPFNPNLSGLSDLRRLRQAVNNSFAQNGQQVTLLLHSASGIMGRILAFQMPEKIRAVVGAAAPIGPDRLGNIHHLTQSLFDAARQEDINMDGRTNVPENPLAALPIPSHWIYTHDDLIVDPISCRDPHGNNHEVKGSHSGLFLNAEVYYLLLKKILPDTLK